VTRVLELNMTGGTGVGAHVSGHTDAGKTGTTDNYADAWFSGYTPRLEATVWIGYPTAEIPMLDVHGTAVSGPTFPADIWHLYMETAIGNRPDVPFPPATGKPIWTSWRGQYQYAGAPAPATTATTTTGATTTTKPPTVHQNTVAPTVVPPTTTEAPPPATTTVEPPPATTTVEPPPLPPATTPPAQTTP